MHQNLSGLLALEWLFRLCQEPRRIGKRQLRNLYLQKAFLITEDEILFIVDDTDDATLENIKPVYDFLYSKGILITKTVVYSPRDKPSSGDSLQRPEYLEFIRDLHRKGFEIALHNVGSGDYTREEILRGVEEFKEKLGFYPRMVHINHSYNKDSIYGGVKNNWPFTQGCKSAVSGNMPENLRVKWRGLLLQRMSYKKLITYNRNHEFLGVNTLSIDPLTPYIDPKRSRSYANHWFSSSFAPNQLVFNYLLSRKNIDKLAQKGGTSIVFTLRLLCHRRSLPRGLSMQ